MKDSTVPVSPDKIGVWEDFVDIVYSPSDVFARRRAAGFWMPLLVVAVVATILSFGTSRILEGPGDADAQRQMREMVRENPDLDVSGARKMTGSIGEVFVWLTGFFVVAMVIGTGLMLWLGGKLAGSAISVQGAILIATYAMVPRLSETVVAIVEGLARGPSNLDGLTRLSWSPARFLDPDTASDMAMFVASAVDLFAIWWLVVLAIGLAVIGHMPRARAAAIVAGIWVVLSLPAFIGAVMG